MNETPSPRSSRRLWLVAGTAIAAGAAWSWWGRQGAQDEAVNSASGKPTSSPQHLGDDFWALALPQPNEELLALRSLQGRPLLINFWATWCPPCVREMPLLDDFYQQKKAQGLQMLGVAVDSPTPVRQFLSKTPVQFPIVLAGADGSGLARALGNSQGGLPYTVLADARGAILERQMGELSADQLARWASRL